MADEIEQPERLPEQTKLDSPKQPRRGKPGRKPRVTDPFPWEEDEPSGYGVESQGAEKPPHLRYQRPEVAKYVARMLIRYNMDYEAAVSKMFEGREVPQTSIVAVARNLESAPQVQQALQQYLIEIGLDTEAQKRLVALAWNAALDKRNDKRWPSAMKLLGDWAGMGKKAGEEKPEPLVAGGALAEKMKKMGLEVTDDKEIPDED